MSATLLVACETHLVRGDDGVVRATTTLGYDFWTRYLDEFDRVLVAARTKAVAGCPDLRTVEGPGVAVAPLPDYRGPWQYLQRRFALVRALRQAMGRVDALLLRAPGPIAGLAWRLRGRRPYGVEVIGDPIDALAPGAIRSAARPIARMVLARELRAMCRDATAVAYVTADALQRRYPTAAWSTSYSDVQLDEDAFADEETVRARYAEAALARRGLPANPWRLVFVGSLAQVYKAPDVAVRALGLCRARGIEAVLTMVGDGRERQGVERLARDLGLAGSVRFLGQVPPGSAVRQVLDASDIFLLPSRTEGLPRAMIEAMARGVVCVGSSAGGIPELLPDDRLACPGDPESLAGVITTLCGAREKLAALAAADQSTALRYREHILQKRRLACYGRLRAALEDTPGGAAGRLRASAGHA